MRLRLSYCRVSALSRKQASLLGAPVGHDFCIISLSDLMTSWEIIEKRITAAAVADFVTAVYNPKSEGRYWQLHRLKEIFLESRSPETPVGYVRQAGREEETVVDDKPGRLRPGRNRYVYGGADRKLADLPVGRQDDYSARLLPGAGKRGGR